MPRSLDKSVSSLEMELAVERARRNGGLGLAAPSRGLPKAFAVVGINTAFSSKRRRDALRDTWAEEAMGRCLRIQDRVRYGLIMC